MVSCSIYLLHAHLIWIIMRLAHYNEWHIVIDRVVTSLVGRSLQPYLWLFVRYSASENGLTLNTRLGVIQGH